MEMKQGTNQILKYFTSPSKALTKHQIQGSKRIDKIISLNEELTAENTRLLEELENQKTFIGIQNNLPILLNDIKLAKLEKHDRQTKRILTIGTIIIFSLAILSILSKWLGVW